MALLLTRNLRHLLLAGGLLVLAVIAGSRATGGGPAHADEVTVVLSGPGTVLVGGESSGPAVCAVSLSPNPTAGASAAEVSATAGCSGSDLDIARVEFFVGPVGAPGAGRQMAAMDGSFDSPEELVVAGIGLRALPPGSHQVSIRALDVTGAWGALASATLSVTVVQEVATYGDTGGIEIPARPSGTAAPAPGATASVATAAATVQVGQASDGSQPGRQFNPAEVTIQAGGLVRWQLFDTWDGQGHDVQAYDGSFSSGPKSGMTTVGEAFDHAFAGAGVYTYYCRTHASLGDADPARIDERIAQGKMVGKIVVEDSPPGAFAVTSQPVAFGVVAVTGRDEDIDAAPATWNVTDTTGTGAGWNVTLVASNFSAPGATIPAQDLRVQLSQAAVVAVTGTSPPTTEVPSFQPLDPTQPLKLLTAPAGSGMGVYDFTPEFRLTVSAETLPGTYTSSITVSLNSGP